MEASMGVMQIHHRKGKKLFKLTVMTLIAGIEIRGKRMQGDGNWKWVGKDFIELDPTTTIVHTGFALGS